MTQSTSFADRIRRIDLLNGVVRIEFGLLEPQGNDQQAPTNLEPAHVVCLPLEGFVQSASLIQGVLRQMVDRGILRPADQNQETQPEGGSPNFG